ncbi:hypothetical protein DTO271G3_3149 [Paecilomyces variotii]|nr:hypothetical protein DTO271G3_3149 [Paecilomyces variotii]
MDDSDTDAGTSSAQERRRDILQMPSRLWRRDWVRSKPPTSGFNFIVGLQGCRILEQEASTRSSGGDNVLETLDATIKILCSRGLKLDLDMVKTAIFAYETRNLLCHSETGNSQVAGDLDRLSSLIDRDQLNLPDALPDDEAEQLDTWRKMLDFYRDSEEIDNMRRAGALLASRPKPDTDLKNAFFPGNIRPKDGRDSDASKKRVTKLARILGEAPGTSTTRGAEEFKRQSEGLLGQLDGLYRKNPSKAHRALEDCKRLVRNMRAAVDNGAPEEEEVPEEEALEEELRAERAKEMKYKRKAAKKNKRKALVEGRKA